MANRQLETKGFFAGLFDFGFTSFITLKFIRVIYAILVGVLLLLALLAFIATISQGGIGIAFAIVVVPIATLLYLIFARISMEMIALFFRIGENTSLMAGSAQPTGATAGGMTPPGYGAPGSTPDL